LNSEILFIDFSFNIISKTKLYGIFSIHFKSLKYNSYNIFLQSNVQVFDIISNICSGVGILFIELSIPKTENNLLFANLLFSFFILVSLEKNSNKLFLIA
jgi:hypothetical protein